MTRPDEAANTAPFEHPLVTSRSERVASSTKSHFACAYVDRHTSGKFIARCQLLRVVSAFVSSSRNARRRRRDLHNRRAAHRAGMVVVDDPVMDVFDIMEQRQTVDQLAERIAELAAPFDVFDVVGQLRFQQERFGADAPTPDSELLAAIEFVALILAARGDRSPVVEGDLPVGELESAMQEISSAAGSALMAGALRIAGTSSQDPSQASVLAMGSALREVFVRNIAYPHMVEDALSELFDHPQIEHDCRAVLGFTVADIRRVFTALRDLHWEAWNARIAAIGRLLEQHESIDDGAAGKEHDLIDRARTEWAEAWGRSETGSTMLPTFDDAVVAGRAAVSPDVVPAIIDLFAVSFECREPGEAAEEFLTGNSPFRTRPILRAPDGNYAVVHQALPTHAIRERVEQQLRTDQAAWNTYQKHRGDYLERAATALIQPHLPGCRTHCGFEYFVPANSTENSPAAYTKLVEGDGLLVLDNIAVVIEAKAVALRPGSRTGKPGPLQLDLRRMVSAASEQGNRLRDRILADHGLRLRDGTWVDLADVREVHVLAVTLDDLSGIATITHEMVNAGLLTEDNLPWVVCLHDLRVVTELVDRPAELLLYLRRRTERDLTQHFRAVDELDYFLYFLAGQLYVDPDPALTRRELPQLPLSNADARRRRRQRQQVELITSLTGDIDDWYRYQLDPSAEPAEKPRMHADPEALELIDTLTTHRVPGWLSMTTTLLGCSDTAQHDFMNKLKDLADATRTDNNSHSTGIIAGSRRGNSYLFAAMTITAGKPNEEYLRRLDLYVRAKKHQMQLDHALGILIDPGTGAVLATVYDNRIPGPDPDLEQLLIDFGLPDRPEFRRHRVGGLGTATGPV